MNRKRIIWSVSAIAAASAVVGSVVPTMAADNNTSVVHVGDIATLSVDISGDATEGDLTVTRSIDGGEPTVIRTVAAPVVSQTVSDTLPSYITASAGRHIILYTVTDAMGVSKTSQITLDVQNPLTIQLSSEVTKDPADPEQVYVDGSDRMFIKLNATGFENGDRFTVERSIDYGSYQLLATDVDFRGEYTDNIANASSYAGAQHSFKYRIMSSSSGAAASSETIVNITKGSTLKSVDFMMNGSKTIEINENQSAVINFSMQTLNSGNPVTLYKRVDGATSSFFKSIPMDGTVQTVSDTISGLSVGTHNVVYSLEDGKSIEFTVIVKAVENKASTAYETLTTYAGIEQDVSLTATVAAPNGSSEQVCVYRSIDGKGENFVSNITADGKAQTLADKLPGLEIGSHKVLYTYKTFGGTVIGYLDVSVTTEKAKDQTSSVSGGTDKQYYTMATGQSIQITGWAQAPVSNGSTTVSKRIDNGSSATVWMGPSDGAKHTYTDTISGLSEGTHTVTYTTHDSGSNTTVTGTVTINVTASGSVTPGTSQTINGTENRETPVTISGKYQASGSTVYVTRSIDSGASTNVTSFTADGVSHSINDTIPALSVGTHRIVYTFTCNNAVVGTSTVILNVSSADPGNRVPSISTQTPVVNNDKVATVLCVSNPRAWNNLTIKRYVDGVYHSTVKQISSDGSYQYITDEYRLPAGTHSVYYSVTNSDGYTAYSSANSITINSSSHGGSTYYATKPTISFHTPVVANYSVSGNVIVNDNDTGDRLTVQRYVDGMLSRTFDVVTPNRTATPVYDRFDLPSGTHTVHYTVTDSYGNTARSEGYYITTPSGTVRPVSGQVITDAPILTVDQSSKTYQSGDAPEVTLKLYTPNYNDRVDLYYQIDNEMPVRFDTVISRGGTSYVTAKLPRNLGNGNHSVLFYAIDSAGNVSNYNGNLQNVLNFKVGDTAPSIQIDSLVNDTSALGEPIDIDFTVSGRSGDTLTVYYYFDALSPTSIGSYRAGESGSVSIPSTGIDAGKHQLNIYAQGSDGTKSTVKCYTITYSGNDGDSKKTVISGDEINNAPIVVASLESSNVTANDQAVISVSVVDKDAGEKVSLYYSVDNGTETLLTTFKSSGSATNKSITLPKLAEGSHTVKIWAKDAKGDVSDADYVTINVTAATMAATVFANNNPTGTGTPISTNTITVTAPKGTIKTGVEKEKDNTVAIVAGSVAGAAILGGGIAIAVKKKNNKNH